MVTVCPSQFATRRTLFHVLVGCGLLMLKVSRLKLPVIWLLVSMWLNTLTKSQIWTLRSEERFSRNAETDLVCRLLLEKKKKQAMGQWEGDGSRWYGACGCGRICRNDRGERGDTGP